MPTTHSRPFLAFAHFYARLAGVLTASAGVVVLFGWWLNLPRLQSLLSGAVGTKANTAAAFILAGTAVWLLQIPRASARVQLARRVCAGVVALIGLLVLTEYAFGWHLGLDELLVRDTSTAAEAFPGRAAFLTALNLVLLGSALLALDLRRAYRLAQGLALVVGAIGLLAVIGYLYGAEGFDRLTAGVPMALPSALVFIICALGLLLARPTKGWVALLASNSAGGLLARRLLPAALSVPVVLGWLRLLGQEAGLYDTRFGLALFATSNILVFAALIVAAARTLYRLDVARQAAEDQLTALNAALEERVEQRTGALTQAIAQIGLEIEERRATDRELKRLKLALDQMAEGAQFVSPDWRYLYLNDAAAAQGRRAPAELLGHTMPEMYPGIEHTALFAALRRCLTEQTPEHFENPFTFPDGSQGWFQLSLEPTPDGVFILSTDITARKQAEAALRASEAKLRALFAALPVGVSVLDAERRVVESNPALTRILRLTPAGLAAGSYAGRTYVHPDGRALAPEDFPSIRAFETQQPVLDVEMGVVTETGAVIWTSVSAVPVGEANIGAVVVTSDITERKQVEAALAQERDLLQALMDNIPDTLYFKDTASRFIRINQAQARLLGLARPEDAYGKSDADFQTPAVAAEALAVEQQIIRTGQPVIDRQEYNPMPSGEERWFTTTKVPLTDRQGRVHGLIGISHDITQRMRTAEGLSTANAALTERVRQMALLHELDEQLQACVNVDEVHQVTAHLVGRLFPDLGGALYRIAGETRWVELATAWGAGAASQRTFDQDDCWALRRSSTYCSGAPYPTHLPCPHLGEASAALAVCIPIQTQGEALGLLHLRAEPAAPAVFDDALVQLTRLVADSVALALANLNLRERLRQQSIRDPLTGLFNRRYLEETLARELHLADRRDRPVGVIMIDLDHFKEINDRYGHSAGDMVLRQLGRYLHEQTRGGDVVCRYGGEEFMVIMPDADLEQTRRRAEQHRETFGLLPIKFGGGQMATVTLSCGVAAYPQHGTTAEALVRAADLALYHAKHEGRNRVAAAE